MEKKTTKKNTNSELISIVEQNTLKEENEIIFSKGLYDWAMFIIVFYSRVRKTLKIDFSSFVILQVVVSHSLYHLNKKGPKTFSEIEENVNILSITELNKNKKLTMSSIANMLQVPRETVRRKTLSLEKKKILKYVGRDGVQLGPNYKTIYKDFVSQTTVDLSKLIKRWKQSGIIDKFLSMSKISDNL